MKSILVIGVGKYIQRVEKTDLKDLKWSDSWNKNPISGICLQK